jgi:hypothetical protein
MKSITARSSVRALFSILFLLALAVRCHAVGFFSTARTPPDYLDHMLLMPDGTVIASQISSDGPSWYRLTPDSTGSYVNGTWSSIAAAHNSRLYFASTVLKDGRAFVAGGEYGNGGGVTAEIYNPSNNTWTVVSPPASLVSPGQIADAECKVLPNGQVLIVPPEPKNLNGTLLFDPATTNWSAGPSTLNLLSEATLVKIPDGSILTVDADLTSSERYVPSANSWISDAATPVSLWASLGPAFIGETGPAFLLPNGHLIFFGGTGHTALYTPSGGTAAGTWVQGPDIPGGNVMADAPGAMLVNGKILIAAGQPPTVQNVTNIVYQNLTTFYEYDYTVGTTGAFTQVTSFLEAAPMFESIFLDLPDGTVFYNLYNNFGMYDYAPDGSPLASGRPIISSISTNSDGSLHFTGLLFNGISEGAAYGDDHQMDSNFPLVRFIDAAGHVRYGRTFNWSSTGVMSGSATTTTECWAPAGSSAQDTIQVVANGIASAGVSLNPIVTTQGNSGVGSLRQAVSNSISGSRITFASALAGKTITLTSGEIPLNQNVVIDGSSLSSPVQVNGNHASRIFDVFSGATVVLNSLVVTNGYTPGGDVGGAVQVQSGGSLSLSNCTLMGNSTGGTSLGGAIYNHGTLTLTACTLAANTSTDGGGIENDSTATASLVNCTLANNVATQVGGAIENYTGQLTLKQCTVSSNATGVDTVAGNVDVVNTIVANNGVDISTTGGTLIFDGTNILTLVNISGSIVQFNGGVIYANPMLGPLTNNGGPTMTMMPPNGYPAVNAGLTSAAAGITYDQRGPGFPRVVGAAVDIGAVEVQSIAATTPFLITGDRLTNGTLGFSFTNVSGASFTIFATTNISLPLNSWSNLGSAIESPLGSGQFHFTDSQAGSSAQRFYTVRSP